MYERQNEAPRSSRKMCGLAQAHPNNCPCIHAHFKQWLKTSPSHSLTHTPTPSPSHTYTQGVLRPGVMCTHALQSNTCTHCVPGLTDLRGKQTMHTSIKIKSHFHSTLKCHCVCMVKLIFYSMYNHNPKCTKLNYIQKIGCNCKSTKTVHKTIYLQKIKS